MGASGQGLPPSQGASRGRQGPDSSVCPEAPGGRPPGQRFLERLPPPPWKVGLINRQLLNKSPRGGEGFRSGCNNNTDHNAAQNAGGGGGAPPASAHPQAPRPPRAGWGAGTSPFPGQCTGWGHGGGQPGRHRAAGDVAGVGDSGQGCEGRGCGQLGLGARSPAPVSPSAGQLSLPLSGSLPSRLTSSLLSL